MKLSIIIPVLNSHEILRRQFLNFEKMGIPDDTEIIIVDDGSEPPLTYKGDLPVTILATNDKRPWTWALARNAGAKIAKGEYILMTDIDHFITKESLDIVRAFNGDRIYFRREFGVLLEDGTFTQDRNKLEEYGFPKGRRLHIGSLPNNFVIRRKRFLELGGYREDRVGKPYPQGEDRTFKKLLRRLESETEVVTQQAPLYMFPNGYYCGDVDFNPFGLFHKLSRATKRNSKYLKQGRN